MANVLKDEKKQQIIALGRLGWSLRKIQEATRVRRETISVFERRRYGNMAAGKMEARKKGKTGHRGDHRLGCSKTGPSRICRLPQPQPQKPFYEDFMRRCRTTEHENGVLLSASKRISS